MCACDVTASGWPSYVQRQTQALTNPNRLWSLAMAGHGRRGKLLMHACVRCGWGVGFVCLQALARAHRMGQQRGVMVLRLVTRGTIEERMLQVSEGQRGGGVTAAAPLERQLLDCTAAHAVGPSAPALPACVDACYVVTSHILCSLVVCACLTNV